MKPALVMLWVWRVFSILLFFYTLTITLDQIINERINAYPTYGFMLLLIFLYIPVISTYSFLIFGIKKIPHKLLDVIIYIGIILIVLILGIQLFVFQLK